MKITKSTLLPSVLILATLYVLVSLGFWTLSRADEKQQIEQLVIAAQQLPIIEIQNLDKLSDKQYQTVELTGVYDDHKQFVYDNQTVNGHAGYYVLTPFITDKSNKAILVNRGFRPWGATREIKNIDIDTQQTTIRVSLVKPIKRIELKSNIKIEGFPKLIQSLDIEKLSALSGYQITPMIAQLHQDQEQGFYRDWKPFYGTAEKHTGYAIQWFAMAFVLLIIAIYLLKKQVIKNSKI